MNLEIRTDEKYLTYIDYDKELAEYFKCSVEEAKKRRSELDFDKEWEKRKVDTADKANKMYAETHTNLFRQARPREKRLVLYRRIMKDILSTQKNYDLDIDFSSHEYNGKQFAGYTMHNVLDYGCGIGDIGLMMSMMGYNVDLLEIGNSELEKFIKWRFAKRNLPCNFIPYGTPLKGGYYDIVVCVDVLEHHEKPREAMKDIYGALRDYGYLFLEYDFHERRDGYEILGDVDCDKDFLRPFEKENFIVKDSDYFWLIKKKIKI